MKNLQKIIILLIVLCACSTLWADDTQPSLLRAIAGDGVVYLDWSRSAKKVKGYWVYRALPGGDFQRLNAQPVKEAFYRDTDVVNGQSYWYLITSAMDRRGNESNPSRSVWASPGPHNNPPSSVY